MSSKDATLRQTVPASTPFPETAKGPGLPPLGKQVSGIRFQVLGHTAPEECQEADQVIGAMTRWLIRFALVIAAETAALALLALDWMLNRF